MSEFLWRNVLLIMILVIIIFIILLVVARVFKMPEQSDIILKPLMSMRNYLLKT